MRRIKRASVIVALSLVLLFMGRGGLHLSPIEMAAAPYLYDLFTWEVSHLPDKWLYKLWSLMPWNSGSREERLAELREFFRIGDEIRSLESEVDPLRASSGNPRASAGGSAMAFPSKAAEVLLDRLDSLGRQRSAMKPGVEETLESEVRAVIDQEGLSSWFGLIFPPVDVALSSPPRVLVVSPRDRIERMETVLLEADMGVDDMEVLEEKIFREQDLAALVQGIGGVATYPTIVSQDGSLRRALILTAHEWLHTYWFFRPLGWNFWSNSQMTTLNETAADLAGKELGNLAYQAITGQKVEEPTVSDPPLSGEAQGPDGADSRDGRAFDFNVEMRKTRLRVDELLNEGRVEDAEAYMEERRRLFGENGLPIRKLNQAFFAFHGTYATSAASTSPIGGEVERARRSVDSVGDFIRTMSKFGSYREFQEHVSRLSDAGDPEPSAGQLMVQGAEG